MLFTIYKEIHIGFGELLNQYKQKTERIRSMNIFEEIFGIPENWDHCVQIEVANWLSTLQNRNSWNFKHN